MEEKKLLTINPSDFSFSKNKTKKIHLTKNLKEISASEIQMLRNKPTH